MLVYQRVSQSCMHTYLDTPTAVKVDTDPRRLAGNQRCDSDFHPLRYAEIYGNCHGIAAFRNPEYSLSLGWSPVILIGQSHPSQLSGRRIGFEKTETADRSQWLNDFLAQKDFSAVFHWFAMFWLGSIGPYMNLPGPGGSIESVALTLTFSLRLWPIKIIL